MMPDSRYRGFAMKWPAFKTGFIPYYNTAWFMTAVAFVCRGISPFVGYRSLGSIFLLSILVVASFTTAGPILFSAIFCATVWNFFFIPPTWTFTITSPEDTMMLISFFVTALVGGLLTSRIRRQESALEARESESRRLYELIKRFSDAKGPNDVALMLSDTIEKLFNAGAAVLLADSNHRLSEKPIGRGMSEKETAVAQWCFENAKQAGWSTQTLSASRCLCLPMKGNSGVVGVVAFYPAEKEKSLRIDTENFLETVIAQTAIVLERLAFRGAAEATKLYEASEKLHQTLLNSVSHELRTPITTLIGATSALKDEKTINDPASRNALTDEVIDAARRLDRVVENLLDVSRLEKGTLQVKREWFEIRELLDRAKNDLKEDLHGKRVVLEGDPAVLIEGDFELLSHAIAQLVLNAAKYTPPESEIVILTETTDKKVRVVVRDQGAGIPPGSEKQIFDKFYRLPGTPAGGIGLGLSIAKSIVELHGGKISAANRYDLHGADFAIELPLKPAPEILREALR